MRAAESTEPPVPLQPPASEGSDSQPASESPAAEMPAEAEAGSVLDSQVAPPFRAAFAGLEPAATSELGHHPEVAEGAEAQSPEPRIPSPEPRVPAAVPERIYFYEVAAEEVEYPEAEVLVDHGAGDGVAASAQPLPEPEAIADAALPFEVRAQSEAAEALEQPQAAGKSRKGAKAGAVNPPSKLPGF